MAFFQTVKGNPSFGGNLGAGIGQGLGSSIQDQLGKFFKEKKDAKTLTDFFASDYGQGLSDENRSLIAGVSKGLLPASALAKITSQADPESDSENVEIMKDAFGERFSKIWKATGQGERTALTNAALDAKFRGLDIQDLLGQVGLREGVGGEEEITEEVQERTPQRTLLEKETVKFPTYELDTSGRTPKEASTYKSDLRKENTKPFEEAVTKSQGAESELRSIKALYKLNESRKLPEGIGQQIRQGVNPLTGNLKIPKFAKAETEVFDKTIKDFTTKAKESFGSRVTNFELGQFLARLPRLVNSYEGRKMITEQMEIFTSLNSLYNTSLRDVYQKYGLGNITPEDAKRIARERIAPQTDKLVQKYEEIDTRITEATKSASKSAPSTSSASKEFNVKSLPQAASSKGKTYEDEKGTRYKSDGKSWKKL